MEDTIRIVKRQADIEDKHVNDMEDLRYQQFQLLTAGYNETIICLKEEETEAIYCKTKKRSRFERKR